MKRSQKNSFYPFLLNPLKRREAKILHPHRQHHHKSKKNTQSPKTPYFNTLGKKQRNTHHYIQNITPSHHRIRQHHLVTHHLIHLPQQTPKNPKRSLENNHWLHPKHQHPTPPLRDQNPPILKPSQTSRITIHTKSLPPHSSPTPTHLRYKKQSTFNNNINYTLNIPYSTQTTSLTQIKNKIKTIHTKNSNRLHIIHSQQNPQQAAPTH